MNDESAMARRYHWLSDNVRSCVNEPHAAVCCDINPEHLRKVLLETYERAPADFETLLSIEGVGAKTLRALALTSELVYGERASLRDPARFSFAHGGKDGTPYPLDRATYDQTIDVMRRALNAAKIGRNEKIHAFRRLSDFSGQAAVSL